MLLYRAKKGDVDMLKKLNRREVQAFIDRFEIKCNSITLEKIQDTYFIIIGENIRFQIDYDIVKKIY